MKFVRLTCHNTGETVYINPRHVEIVRPGGVAATDIWNQGSLNDSEPLEVMQTVEDVVALIEEALS